MRSHHKLLSVIFLLGIILWSCDKPRSPYETALLGARPVKLDPAGAPEYAELTLLNQICGKLLSIKKTLELEGDLAESWEVDATQKTYTFHLNPVRHFPDGDTVRAEDVVFTLQRLGDSKSSMVSGWLDEISSIQQASRTTVIISLKKPNQRFLYKLAHPRFCVLHKDMPFRDVAGLGVPNSSGPYEIISSADREIRLEVTPDFAHRAIEHQIIVHFLAQSQAIQLFRDKVLDDLSFYLLSDEEIAALGPATLIRWPLHWTWMLSLNPNRPPFTDQAARRQFLSSLDVYRIRQEWGAMGHWNLSVIPEGMVGYIPVTQDVVLPKGEPFRCDRHLQVNIIGGVERETRLADALKRELQIGSHCDSTVSILPMNEYGKSLVAGSADIYVQAMDSESPDPLTFYENYIAGHADNFLFSQNSKLAEIYGQLYDKQAEKRTTEDYEKIQRTFFEEAYGLPIGNPEYRFAYQHEVKNVQMNPFGMIFNRWFEIGR